MSLSSIGDSDIYILKSIHGDYLVYAPLRSFLARVSPRLAKTLRENNCYPIDPSHPLAPALNELDNQISNRPLINLGSTLRGRKNEEINFSPTLLGLAVTMDCNLACSYCHANAGKSKKLDLNIGYAAIDIVVKNAASSNQIVEVSLGGGGEPTTAWSNMVHFIDYLDMKIGQQGIKRSLSMATNGILSNNQREYITNNFNWISLSFDGPEDIQNKQRPMRNGGNSFPVVYETAKNFIEAKFPFSVRATVSNESVNRLCEIVDFFATEFPGIGIGLEPLHEIGRGCTSPFGKPNLKVFAREFQKILELSESKGIQIVNSGIGRVNEIRTSFCKSLSQPAFNVSINGLLHACLRDGTDRHEFEYGFWNEKDEQFEWDIESIRAIRRRAVSLERKCKKCFARYHCAGDCLDLKLAGSNRCIFNREIVRYMLSKRLN